MTRASPAAKFRYRSFGFSWESDLELDGLLAATADEPTDVRLRSVRRKEIAKSWSGAAMPARVWRTEIDGRSFSVERGRDDDLQIRWGEAEFHLAPDRSLSYAVNDATSPAWRRVLLDSVLVTVALELGFEALHAAAVELPDGLLAIVAGTGGGKTTLSAELVARGNRLFCDDVLVIERARGSVVAHPGPALMNLPANLDATSLGTTLAQLGDENWVHVDRTATEARSVDRVILLERTSECTGATIALAPGAHRTLTSAGLQSGPDSSRRVQRFETTADLAESTPMYRLEAGIDVPPDRLADLAQSTFRHGAATT